MATRAVWHYMKNPKERQRVEKLKEEQAQDFEAEECLLKMERKARDEK